MDLTDLSKEDIQAFIKRRRKQVIAHSCIYYELNESVISDDTWQKWANELAAIQDQFPEYHKVGFYDKEFLNWDGTSGAFLPLKDEWVYNEACWLLALHEEKIEKMTQQELKEQDKKRKKTKKEVFNELFE